MKKILCIIGPTAVGKTALSVSAVSKINGILFSADSIQVYKSLDIISGKDKDTLKNTSYALIDIVSPFYTFNVSDYLKELQKVLEALPHEQTPVIVGGTGFYVLSLLEGVETVNTQPDEKLRKKLSTFSTLELQEYLKKIHPEKLESMNNSDRNNPRRLVRAIEVAQNVESIRNGSKALEGFDILIVGLTCRKDLLNSRIDKRVEERIKQGALFEAKNLYKDYEKLAPQIKRANGYRQLFGYLQNEYSLGQAVEKWKIAEHQNAKKQMTFFKKIKDVQWFDIETVQIPEILHYIEEWYNKKV